MRCVPRSLSHVCLFHTLPTLPVLNIPNLSYRVRLWGMGNIPLAPPISHCCTAQDFIILKKNLIVTDPISPVFFFFFFFAVWEHFVLSNKHSTLQLIRYFPLWVFALGEEKEFIHHQVSGQQTDQKPNRKIRSLMSPRSWRGLTACWDSCAHQDVLHIPGLGPRANNAVPCMCRWLLITSVLYWFLLTADNPPVSEWLVLPWHVLGSLFVFSFI